MGNIHNIPDTLLDESCILENEISEEFFKHNYRLLSSIDCGANGQVLKYEFGGRAYAVKEMKFGENSPLKLSDIKNEIMILQYVNKLEPKLSYFVKYYGFSLFSSQRIALIYELADGNLSDLIEKRFLNIKGEDLFSEFANVLISLVKALTFLEMHNLAHRDLKPQNVLFKMEKVENKIRFSYILCDFGISKLCDLGTQMQNTTAGSPIFMSPEVTFNFYNQVEKGVSNPFKSDVYSLGLLLLKVILNKSLSSKERMIEKDFDPNQLDAGPNDMKINQMIEECYEFFLKISCEKYKSNKIKIILKHMLMYNTKRRPDIFGIYSFMINMGFIKSYEEIDSWLLQKHQTEYSKQMNQIMKQNELLMQENQRLKTENETLKLDLSHSVARKDFFEKTTSSIKAFKSEKNFNTLDRHLFMANSASYSNSPNPYKKSFELPPANDFIIGEYTGRTKTVGKYLVFQDKKIGKGSFGDIFLGCDSNDFTIYAVKERKINSKLASSKEKFFELLKREVNNAKLLMNHPNIVAFIDIIQEECDFYVICEYCQDGSLSYQLQKKGRMEEIEVLSILKQIIEGFKVLHSNNVIHRNLKPSSILLHKGIAKITGFYFSKHVLDADKKQLMTSFGTPQYMAPEIFEAKEYCSKCDIWSLGITLFEMLYGEFPWRGKTTHDLIENNIKKKNLAFPENIAVSQKIKELIASMLIVDQEKRISWNELFAVELVFSHKKILLFLKMIQIRAEFISGAINSIYHALSWSHSHNIIAYSCSNQIFLYNPIDSKVFATLPSKSKRANSVEFLENFENCTLVSTDSEGVVAIWECLGNKVLSHENWKLKFKQNIQFGVENVSTLEISKDCSLILAHNINGDIVLFNLNDLELKKLGSLSFGTTVQETSNMIKIDDDTILLFLGGLDHKLHVYHFSLKEALDQREDIFHYLLTLKGHENSITDISSVKVENNSILIASSSKDSYIRLWRFHDKKVQNLPKGEQEIFYANKNNHTLKIGQSEYELNLESILSIHTEPVSSVKWGKITKDKAFEESNLTLLTSSFDFSLLLWTKDEKSGVWINKYRLGQMGGNKNAFFGIVFNKDFDKIMAYTYHGCFYLWSKLNDDWVSLPCVSGHFSRVTDMDWNSSNEYLVSCSQDQTTRIFAKWVEATGNWYEVSRAQIHGYDINSVKNLPIKTPEKKLLDMIICGADEKIVRLFEPTAIVANLINKLSKTSLRLYFPTAEEESQYLLKPQSNEVEYRTFTEGGAQVLGLMTKAVKQVKEKFTNYYDEEDEGGNLDENDKNEGLAIKDFNQPPTEDYLAKHTLWPEINKMYGHGFEMQTVTANHEGTLIASSCKSQTQEHSAIFLWNPTNYSIVDKLYVHNYTVVQMEFSRNDEFLGSVSRDRQFVLFKRNKEDPKKPYKLFFVDKSHARIIWSLSFSHDNQLCSTGSRDKKIKLWKIEEKVALAAEKTFNEAITAIAFGDKNLGEKAYLVTVGLENGNVFILRVDFKEENKGEISVLGRIDEFLGHSLTVNRIRFREVEGKNQFQIASCADDHSVRIFELKSEN